MKIDAFPHILPPRFLAAARAIDPKAYPANQLAGRPALVELDERFRMTDRYDDYVQILTLTQPPLELIGDGSRAVELQRIANDELAEIVRGHPDRFLGFACALAMEDPDAAIREIERAVGDLGALGAQIHTNVRGVALDDPRFEPFWARVEQLDRAVWVHPARGPSFPDYATETSSKYGTFIALGWPYETAVFMGRLAYSGVLDRHPGLRILTHHAGGMIPSFAQRFGKGVAGSDARRDVVADMKRYYADTALNGNLAAVRCGLEFFGSDRLLFGTDMPYGEDDGEGYLRDTIANVEALDIGEADRRAIFEGNARRLLGAAVAVS